MTSFTKGYYESTHNLKPSALLTEALKFIRPDSHTALDLGCGAGRDTKLLLQEGYDVTAIDSNPLVEPYLQSLGKYGNVSYIQTKIQSFSFKRYDLINARYSLPFIPPKDCHRVMKSIGSSLSANGIFVGQLFGLNDDWNKSNHQMTFLSKSEAKDYFNTLEILKFEETDKDGKLADGTNKHWHVYDIIARQK